MTHFSFTDASPHLSEEDLVLLYYGEPDAPAGASAHLAQCAECSERAESLASMLDACGEWGSVEVDPGFDAWLWRRVTAGLEHRRQQYVGFRFFAWASALALLLIAAFVAGRATKRPAAPVMSGLSAEARERVLAISLADHLDRAEILLTDVENGAGSDRTRAADLVTEGRLLRSALNRADQPGTLALLDDIERLLVELANQPDRPDTTAMRALRKRIEDDSLVFRIRIIQSNLRTRGQRL